MHQAVSHTDGLDLSQMETQPWELNRRITAVYSTFICSKTFLASSQLLWNWLVRR